MRNTGGKRQTDRTSLACTTHCKATRGKNCRPIKQANEQINSHKLNLVLLTNILSCCFGLCVRNFEFSLPDNLSKVVLANYVSPLTIAKTILCLRCHASASAYVHCTYCVSSNIFLLATYGVWDRQSLS